MAMTGFLWFTHIVAFIGGGVVYKVYQKYIQADVTKLNQTVAAAKSTANTVAGDIKKL